VANLQQCQNHRSVGLTGFAPKHTEGGSPGPRGPFSRALHPWPFRPAKPVWFRRPPLAAVAPPALARRSS